MRNLLFVPEKNIYPCSTGNMYIDRCSNGNMYIDCCSVEDSLFCNDITKIDDLKMHNDVSIRKHVITNEHLDTAAKSKNTTVVSNQFKLLRNKCSNSKKRGSKCCYKHSDNIKEILCMGLDLSTLEKLSADLVKRMLIRKIKSLNSNEIF